MRISDWSSDVCSSDLSKALHKEHGWYCVHSGDNNQERGDISLFRFRGESPGRACEVAGGQEHRRQCVAPIGEGGSPCGYRAACLLHGAQSAAGVGGKFYLPLRRQRKPAQGSGKCLYLANQSDRRASWYREDANDIEHHRQYRDSRQNRRYSVQRSEEHTSELQSLMRISYAVFCLK